MMTKEKAISHIKYAINVPNELGLTVIDIPTLCEALTWAESVRRGRWIELAMTGEYKCSVCGRGSRSENIFQYIPKLYWNYCPNCGAKMEEEK